MTTSGCTSAVPLTHLGDVAAVYAYHGGSGAVGHHRCRQCDRTQERAGISAGRALRTGRGHAAQRDLAADYARRHGPRWYDDADELINDPDVDAVYVATPPDSHREYGPRRAGRQAGLRREADGPHRAGMRGDDRGLRAGRGGAVRGLLPSRDAALRHGQGILDSGRIGPLRSVSIRNERPARSDGAAEGWRVDPEISGGGHFVDLGSHILDLLDWLLGPVTYAAGIATNRGGRYPPKTW